MNTFAKHERSDSRESTCVYPTRVLIPIPNTPRFWDWAHLTDVPTALSAPSVTVIKIRETDLPIITNPLHSFTIPVPPLPGVRIPYHLRGMYNDCSTDWFEYTAPPDDDTVFRCRGQVQIGFKRVSRNLDFESLQRPPANFLLIVSAGRSTGLSP